MGKLVHDESTGWFKGRYIDSGGRRRFHRLSRIKREAEKMLAALEGNAVIDRRLGVRPIKQVRFAAFCEKFLEFARTDAKKCKRYECSVANALAFFGNQIDLMAIDAEMVEQFKQSRMRTGDVQGSTVNRDLQALKRLFNKAIDWGYARENPVKKVDFFRESFGRVRYLTREEFGKVLAVAAERLRPVIIFAVQTGMRQAEILGLTWSDMDLENRYASLYEVKNGDPRKVAMNRTAIEAVLPFKLSKSEYVFCDGEGRSLPARTVLWQFKKVLAAAEIRDFRFHDLRHTCASWMAMAGVSVEKIKSQLGHKDIRMTMRYMHLAPDGIRSGADQLDRWFRSEPPRHGPPAGEASIANG